MKFTTIIAAALPLLAAAAPRSIYDGSQQGDGQPPSTRPEQSNWAAAPGGSGQDGHQPPTEFGPAPNHGDGDMVAGDASRAHDGHMPGQLEHRDLEARDDMDHYIEECSNDMNVDSLKNCVRNLVVPKGQVNGGCVARMQKGAFMGTMHLLESNVMCKYYRDADCKGKMSGPYSNNEIDYTIASYYYGQIISNPQSMFCELIGFQAPRLPVKPPKPDPIPPSNYDGKIASFMQDPTSWPLSGDSP